MDFTNSMTRDFVDEAIGLGDDRMAALIAHLDDGTGPDDITDSPHSGVWGEGAGYEIGQREYAVLTEEEAGRAWEKSLDTYLEDAVLSEIHESVQHYFDTEKWKRDARIDGRAHSINCYDGDEHEVEINGTLWLVYRTN